MLTHPVQQLAAIRAIDPNPPQFLARAAHSLEQFPRAFGVGDRCSSHHHCQEQAQGVNQQVTFAPRDQLAVVEAALTTHAGGFDTLAVQAACGWMFVMTSAAPDVCAQGVVEALPSPVIAPDTEGMVDTFPVRIVFGQHASLGASDQNIQDGIDDLTHIQAARSTTRFGGRDQIFDTIPVAVRQIGRVCLCFHTPNVHDALC